MFLIRSHDPASEIADKMEEEADKNIELLNTGKASLSWQTTGDSSKGIIREVGTISGALLDAHNKYTKAKEICDDSCGCDC